MASEDWHWMLQQFAQTMSLYTLLIWGCSVQESGVRDGSICYLLQCQETTERTGWNSCIAGAQIGMYKYINPMPLTRAPAVAFCLKRGFSWALNWCCCSKTSGWGCLLETQLCTWSQWITALACTPRDFRDFILHRKNRPRKFTARCLCWSLKKSVNFIPPLL